MEKCARYTGGKKLLHLRVCARRAEWENARRAEPENQVRHVKIEHVRYKKNYRQNATLTGAALLVSIPIVVAVTLRLWRLRLGLGRERRRRGGLMTLLVPIRESAIAHRVPLMNFDEAHSFSPLSAERGKCILRTDPTFGSALRGVATGSPLIYHA